MIEVLRTCGLSSIASPLASLDLSTQAPDPVSHLSPANYATTISREGPLGNGSHPSLNQPIVAAVTGVLEGPGEVAIAG